MGFLDKLKFWKREDEFSFDELATKEISEGGLQGQDTLGLGEKEEHGLSSELFPNSPLESGTTTPPPGSFGFSPPQGSLHPQSFPVGPNRELELISSKLDTIKVLLDSLDRRMASLERTSGAEPKQRLW